MLVRSAARQGLSGGQHPVPEDYRCHSAREENGRHPEPMPDEPMAQGKTPHYDRGCHEQNFKPKGVNKRPRKGQENWQSEAVNGTNK